MNPSEIRELLLRDPFEPFRIKTTGGDGFSVRDPQSVALGKNRLFIAFTDTDGWAAVPYLHIATIESLNGHARPRRKGR